MPKTGHVNGQGYVLAQIIPGGKLEVILAAEDGIYCFEVPKDPEKGNWPKTRIASETMDEGIGTGDIDSDGDIDIVCGRKHGNSFSVVLFANPSDGGGDWAAKAVGPSVHAPDRIVLADINGDGRLDVAVSEERSPGKEPDANLYWYEQLAGGKFERHTIITEYSLNNLDVADLDRDGDFDIVTCEHKGPKGKFKLQISPTGVRKAISALCWRIWMATEIWTLSVQPGTTISICTCGGMMPSSKAAVL
jgi:hypothetical protein